MSIARLVSGGQTGVDRAALDAALDAGIACGGWCPQGRRAEDGVVPDRYPLTETSGAGYRARTRLNVTESDGTLVLLRGVPTGGTAYTVRWAARSARPCLVVRIGDGRGPDEIAAEILQWIDAAGIRTLNVAGPRESAEPGIGAAVRPVLDAVLNATRPPA